MSFCSVTSHTLTFGAWKQHGNTLPTTLTGFVALRFLHDTHVKTGQVTMLVTIHWYFPKLSPSFQSKKSKQIVSQFFLIKSIKSGAGIVIRFKTLVITKVCLWQLTYYSKLAVFVGLDKRMETPERRHSLQHYCIDQPKSTFSLLLVIFANY